MFFCFVFAMPLCASSYLCHLFICWERAGLLGKGLSFGVSNFEFVTFQLVSGSGVVLDCIDS